MVAFKFTFKEMKRREMSRTEKDEFILTCDCANMLRSARLKNEKLFLVVFALINFEKV